MLLDWPYRAAEYVGESIRLSEVRSKIVVAIRCFDRTIDYRTSSAAQAVFAGNGFLFGPTGYFIGLFHQVFDLKWIAELSTLASILILNKQLRSRC
ncbi:MAG: hypothetical protein C5B53_03090 [Candidatus Melainabacteria bacterium]|nr:MAG: hypothetical protein C5B53_03090 [Candidatus Melainabacteria bacterium]